MDIYWIKDKRQCGPSTVPDIISLLQVGEITPETLGWHSGCKKWLPLRELPALADFLNKKPAGEEQSDTPEKAPAVESPPPAVTPEPEELPAPPAEESRPPETEELPDSPSEPETSPRVYLPSPVARLLARFVDCGLYAVLYGGVITIQGIPYSPSLILLANPLLWLPMLVLEAWMLSSIGTTPGKALMGIHVVTFGDAPRLSFLRALMRSIMVFTLGMAFMIVQLMPIMLVFEYWMLRRRGITPWDARNSTLPTQKSPSTPSRFVLSGVLLYVSMVLFFSAMKPWLPGMIDDIGKTNPELALTLRSMLPNDIAQQHEPSAAQDTPAPSTESPAPAPQDTSLPGI